MQESGLKFTASDGKEIAYRRVEPGSKPRALALIVHGMNDYGGRFLVLADSLAAIGIASYIPDLRGHGDTDARENRGYLADEGGFERVVKDLVELCDFAVKEREGLPIYYFGHSFGALLGMALCGTHGGRFAGVLLSAPPEKPSPLLESAGAAVVRLGKMFKGARAPARLPRKMTFGAYAKTVPNAQTGSDWISRDPKTVASYISDPQCNFVCSYGFYDDLMDGVRQVYAEGFLGRMPKALPLYLFCGSMDPVIGMRAGYEKLADLFRGLGLADFESKCYEGGRHESLNETNRAEVLSDIASWFSRRLA